MVLQILNLENRFEHLVYILVDHIDVKHALQLVSIFHVLLEMTSL